jgi:hypothetical protein
MDLAMEVLALSHAHSLAEKRILEIKHTACSMDGGGYL